MKKILILLILLIAGSYSEAQDTTKSLAFKNNRPIRRSYFFYQPDLSYQILQQFKLIEKANSGDPEAQHELAIRYFLGEGMAPDSVQAAYWMKKAADQNLTSACYNYGIFLLRGEGVEWNPFEAFKYFRKAAIEGMPRAQYNTATFYVSDLVVKNSWSKAYEWFKKSAEADFEPATKILKKIEKLTPAALLDTSLTETKDDSIKLDNYNSSSLSYDLIYVDFDIIDNPGTEITDEDLIDDLLRIPEISLNNLLTDAEGNLKFTSIENLPLNIEDLEKYADYGSPEALVILGKFYEEGIYYKKDKIKSLFYYLHALKNDSPTAQVILNQIELNKDFFTKLKALVDSGNTDAMYIWYVLTSIGLNTGITEPDALNLLNTAALLNHLPSLVELGLLYYTGKIVNADKLKAEEIWKFASTLGSNEAKVRLLAIKLLEKNDFNPDDFSTLNDYLKKGSLFAQFLSAYCYENGIGVGQIKAEAAENYRIAAQRGNRLAYQELKRMYDEIRPDDPEFQVSN